MAEARSLEALFLENLAVIDRAAALAARRSGLADADAEREDFISWVRLKIIENDYAVLQKFRGESSVSTYLNVVIAMLARDYRVQHHGRWRPSALARRKGDLAIRLEMLIHRRGASLQEAVQTLRTSGATTLSPSAIGRLFSELPRRLPLRPARVPEVALSEVAAAAGADSAYVADSTREEYDRALAVVETVMGRCPAEDRLILQLHFWDGLGVSEISRALSLEQKPLYRRLERLIRDLRKELETQGVDRETLRELLSEMEP